MINLQPDKEQRQDLRCNNPECELYRLKLESDEVAPTPGAQPDQCAACGHLLEAIAASDSSRTEVGEAR